MIWSPRWKLESVTIVSWKAVGLDLGWGWVYPSAAPGHTPLAGPTGSPSCPQSRQSPRCTPTPRSPACLWSSWSASCCGSVSASRDSPPRRPCCTTLVGSLAGQSNPALQTGPGRAGSRRSAPSSNQRHCWTSTVLSLGERPTLCSGKWTQGTTAVLLWYKEGFWRSHRIKGLFTETIKNGWNDGEPVQASADSFDARRGRISTFWPQKKNGVWE